MARYRKASVCPRFPVYSLLRRPEPVSIKSDLEFRTVTCSPQTPLASLRAIDKAILDFERPADHEFLLNDRNPYLFYRGNQVVGYGYFGKGLGPIALLDESDFQAMLAHAETEAAIRREDEFMLQVLLIDRAAVDYLLAHGFQFEPFSAFFMSDAPLGKFENYMLSSPPIFL